MIKMSLREQPEQDPKGPSKLYKGIGSPHATSFAVVIPVSRLTTVEVLDDWTIEEEENRAWFTTQLDWYVHFQNTSVTMFHSLVLMKDIGKKNNFVDFNMVSVF